MSDELKNNGIISGLSVLQNAFIGFQEAVRPSFEALKQLLDIIDSIKESLNRNMPSLIRAGRIVLSGARVLSAISKLGEAQFVYWDYLEPELIDTLCDSDNANNALEEFIVSEKYQIKDIIERTLSCPILAKHCRLYSQAINAFMNDDCDLAVTGFTAVFDGLLSEITSIRSPGLKCRIKIINDKLEKDEVLEHDEYAMLALVLTLKDTLESFSANSDFSNPEPYGLNRHWIAHGRSIKKKTKLDCVKLINLIYGLLLIHDIDSRITASATCENVK